MFEPCCSPVWPFSSRVPSGAAKVQLNTGALQDATAEYGAGPTAVFVNSNTGYVFFIQGSDDNVVYVKTTDGGYTWTSEISIGDDQDTGNVSVWYDKWTPRDAETRSHLRRIGAGGTANPDDLMYNYLDTADDSVGMGQGQLGG